MMPRSTPLMRDGVPVKYFTGAGWNRSGQFTDRASWENYVKAFAAAVAKPLTITVEESQDLVKLTKKTGRPFIVAYTYTGLPMVMLARELVRSGDIGEVRKVEAWYPQGWLAGRTVHHLVGLVS